MLKKLVSLAAVVVSASLLALPAVAAPPAGKSNNAGAGATCRQAVVANAKTFYKGQRDARKTFRDQAKAARETFLATQPTDAQRKTFHEGQVAAVKAFHAQQKNAREAFRASQKAAMEACKAGAHA